MNTLTMIWTIERSEKCSEAFCASVAMTWESQLIRYSFSLLVFLCVHGTQLIHS